jgi:hypothetical protein
LWHTAIYLDSPNLGSGEFGAFADVGLTLRRQDERSALTSRDTHHKETIIDPPPTIRL